MNFVSVKSYTEGQTEGKRPHTEGQTHVWQYLAVSFVVSLVCILTLKLTSICFRCTPYLFYFRFPMYILHTSTLSN